MNFVELLLLLMQHLCNWRAIGRRYVHNRYFFDDRLELWNLESQVVQHELVPSLSVFVFGEVALNELFLDQENFIVNIRVIV